MKRRSRSQRRAYANLRAWRKDSGLSQAEAAMIFGISQISYSRFERGARFLKGPLAKQFVARTGVPLEVLVGAA